MMLRLSFALLAFALVTPKADAQTFSQRVTLLENLGFTLNSDSTINSHDAAYGTLLGTEPQIVTYLDQELTVYDLAEGIAANPMPAGTLFDHVITFADLNADGRRDIVGSSQFVLSTEEGGYTETVHISTAGMKGRVMAVTDFDGDENYDFITLERIFASGAWTQTIYIYLLDARQQVLDNITFTPPSSVKNVVPFDHDDDGDVDLAYTLDEFGADKLIVQTNQGDGTFSAQTVEVVNTDEALAIGNFDEDRFPEILLTGHSGRDLQMIDHDGQTFTRTAKVVSAQTVFAVQVAHLNGDDISDIAYLENENYDSLRVMVAYGLGDGTFGEPRHLGSVQFEGANYKRGYRHSTDNWISIVDYDRDGDQDILVTAALEKKLVAFINQGTLPTTANIKVTTEDRITLFPNPVSSTLTVASPAAPRRIAVYDVLGALVSQNENRSAIDVSNLKSGIYLVSVFDATGGRQSFKVRKN